MAVYYNDVQQGQAVIKSITIKVVISSTNSSAVRAINGESAVHFIFSRHQFDIHHRYPVVVVAAVVFF